jgi:hypothetical protein
VILGAGRVLSERAWDCAHIDLTKWIVVIQSDANLSQRRRQP